MATSAPGFVYSGLKAERDMSGTAGEGTAYKYRFMEIGTAAGEFDRCDTAKEPSIGVLQNAPESGKSGSIMSDGISKVEAGAAVTRGAQVSNDNEGRGVDATGVGDICHGVALTAAANAGDLFDCLLLLNGTVHD